MESTRKRIRRDFAPLTVSVQLRCTTPASPVGQVYNNENAQYEPDRTLTPTVILPDVQAFAKDGSWAQKQVNSLLTSYTWYVNGVDISTISSWNGYYTIQDSGDTKGAITITKNVSPGDTPALSFSAVFADSRIGCNVYINTEPMVLSTSKKCDDEYTVSIGEAKSLQYDMTKDMLAVYEYEVAHGIRAASSTARSAAIAEGGAYERTIPIVVYKGGTRITTGYSVDLYELSGSTWKAVELAYGNPVYQMSLTQILMDMRLLTKQDYLLRVTVGSKTVAELQFSVNRVYPSFSVVPANGASIMENDVAHYNKALASCGDKVLKYPGLVLDMVWKTDSYNKTAVEFNAGDEALISLNKTGIGDAADENWLDVYVEAGHKAAYSVAGDASGNKYGDSSGQLYIWN